MRAAIYARKSNEQDVSDDAKSVTRQIELARTFCEKQGWSTDDLHVCKDDGVSGAEFEDRPGLTKLVLAAKSKPRQFDVLVTMDQDRIGRDQIRTPQIINDLVEAGVRIFYYATGQELRFDSPTDKLIANITNFGNEWYRYQVRIKTREAMRSTAQNGYVAGGKVYGYTNVRDGSHVRRVINDAGARVIRRIFQLCAEGKGLLSGKPDSGLESRYLLSGFLRCGVCGGNLIISKKTGQRGRPQTTYVCSTRRTRREAVCANKNGVPAPALTDAVLAQLKRVFLNPAALGCLLMREWEERRKAPEELAAQRRELAAQVANLDFELKRLADAVASGSAPQTILQAISAREAERRELQAKLEHLDGLAIESEEEFDLNAWLEETKGLFEDLRETLEANPTVGRQVLRRLLVGPITVTPRAEGGMLFFDFSGTSSYAEYAFGDDYKYDLAIAAPAIRMVSQAITGRITRRVQRWCPRGDSNTRHAV
jgi:DNA invertase Pin-like site-specific DNA recombinase